MHATTRDVVFKHEQYAKKTDATLAQYRKEINRFEKEMSKYASKKAFDKLDEAFTESKESFDR